MFGPFALDTRNGSLLRAGVPVPLGYRATLLLTEFASRPGVVLGKTDLMDAAWPGMTVEESNLSVQVSQLRKLLGETPDGGEWITTIPRIGYRFAAIQGTFAQPNVWQEPGPSIAVLPFETLSIDPEQEHFADGLAEELTMRLARLRWLMVASRNSSFSYRGQPSDARRIGRELNVRYILGGSIRRSADGVRVACELSDTTTGFQVWADRYDSDLGSFFDLQDRITGSVVAAIEPRLYAAEHEHACARPPGNLDAWGLVMQAMPYAWTWGTAMEIASAEALLRRAIGLDPDYARANSLLAWTQAARVQLGLDERKEVLQAAREAALRALSRDPEDPWTHFAAGYVHMVGREFDPAVAALNEAIELNPSMAVAHMILGSAYGYGGMPDDGLHHLVLAARLSPRDFSLSANYATTGMCHMIAGRLDTAIVNLRRAVELRPHFGTAWRTLAATAGLANDVPLASHALAEAQRLHPTLSLAWIEAFHPIVRSEDRARYSSGLMAAGLV